MQRYGLSTFGTVPWWRQILLTKRIRRDLCDMSLPRAGGTQICVFTFILMPELFYSVLEHFLSRYSLNLIDYTMRGSSFLLCMWLSHMQSLCIQVSTYLGARIVFFDTPEILTPEPDEITCQLRTKKRCRTSCNRSHEFLASRWHAYTFGGRGRARLFLVLDLHFWTYL